MKTLPFAPSAPIQGVPKAPIVGDADVSGDEDSDLDRRITRRLRDAHLERYGDELSGEEEEEENAAEEAAAMEEATSNMTRTGSMQAAMTLTNGTARGVGQGGSKLKQNGAAFGHDLASSYLLDRSRNGLQHDSELVDVLANKTYRRGSGTRSKRTFFASRAAAMVTTTTAATEGAARDLEAAQAAAYYAAASSALNPWSVSVTADTPTPSKALLGHLVNGHGQHAHPGANGSPWGASATGKEKLSLDRSGNGKRRAGKDGPGIWNGEPVESDDGNDGASTAADSSSVSRNASRGRNGKTFQRIGTGIAMEEQKKRQTSGAA